MHYGAILNNTQSVKRIGSLDRPPYKGAPKAPVLYLTPANTLANAGARMEFPVGAASAEVGATVGLVIGAPASRLAPQNAVGHVREVVLACDLSLPHESVFRSPIREKCFDGTLVVGPNGQVSNLPGLAITTTIAGKTVDVLPLDDLIREPAQLLADVSGS